MRRLLWIALPVFIVGALRLEAQPLAPDPGPPQTLALPLQEVSLFGHSADPLHDTIRWSLVSGPAEVAFTAPWALMTTVQMSVPGTYVFSLAVTNAEGTSSAMTTVNLNPASAMHAFYVDPSFSSLGQGTRESPWSDFRDTNPLQALQWTLINQALASSDVIIYFSGRDPTFDVPQVMTTGPEASAIVRVIRTDTGPHRLILDGMTLYNTNESVGDWAFNLGFTRMRLVKTGGCCISIGWDNEESYDHVTIRGFEITGSGARIRWGGSDSTLEYLWVHDITTLGATVQLNGSVRDGTCIPIASGIDHEITLRHNRIERGIGEGIYIAGNYNIVDDGGCVEGPFSGDNHHNILLEENIVIDAGINGDEGDSIDFKAGIYDITIRGNVLVSPHAGPNIGTLGQMPNSTHASNFLIEQNVTETNGPGFPSLWLNGVKGAIVRNNVIRNCLPDSGGALAAQTRLPPLTPNASQLQLYNNTVDGCPGFGFFDIDDQPRLRNNIFLTPYGVFSATAGIDSDYNVFAVLAPLTPEGPHSILVPSANGIVVEAGVDDHLAVDSPAMGAGFNLAPTFAVDIERSPRPAEGPWDVGAYVRRP